MFFPIISTEKNQTEEYKLKSKTYIVVFQQLGRNCDVDVEYGVEMF